jgi:hypothetical protein
MSAAFVGPDFVLLTYISKLARPAASAQFLASTLSWCVTTTPPPRGNLGQRRLTGLRRWTIVPRSANFAQMRLVIVPLPNTWQPLGNGGKTSG